MLSIFFPKSIMILINKKNSLYKFLYKIKYREKLTIGSNVIFRGSPIIDICDGARISIGNNVILNSINFGHHVLLNTSVKLMADREGALITIGDNTRIHGSCLHAYQKVTIGKNCLIGANCNIIDGNGHDLCFDNVEERYRTIGSARDVIIEDNVWIGANSIILPGTYVGYGSIIGAGSVVRGSVPPFCIFAGNPAKIVKQYKDYRENKKNSFEI